MPVETLVWWSFLCGVSIVNVLAWLGSAAVLKRRHATLDPEDAALRRLLLLLSAGYVAGCAWRSVLPVFDVPRQAMVDGWYASAFVGRSIATVAELCFAAQWARLLRAAALNSHHDFGRAVSFAVLPLIGVAEICSWYSVLSTSNLGHVMEESLWGLTAALLVASLVALRPRSGRRIRLLLAGCGLIGMAYVAYMFAVDVPMYWARWLADEAHGRNYLSLSEGIVDAATRWHVRRDWQDWKSEALWMSLYFSVAVWLSIALVHLPLPAAARQRQLPRAALPLQAPRT